MILPFRYPLTELRGPRVIGGYVRLAFPSRNPDEKGELVCCDFFLPGGPPEFLAFYAKLVGAYERATGLSFKDEGLFEHPAVPEMPLVAD